MGDLVDKAAGRDDINELVRLAWAYPKERAAIDLALVEVAQRLPSERKAVELAHILTLPEVTGRWLAVETAIRELVQLGPQVAPQVWAASANSHRAANLAGAARSIQSYWPGQAYGHSRIWPLSSRNWRPRGHCS